MTVRRITLAGLAILALAGAPASAQFESDDDDDDPPHRPLPPPDYYDESPRYRGGYDYGGPRRGFGRVCITARGNCPTRPGPLNAPCACEIPGFGLKRGAIGG
ncbi:hypothetical protein Q8W71_23860 [Methylobacterium sp. NEAU 140]|uniref:hypothetical protein n=1 Tax=Methylobacterium sp. NEAU 140 TaxID=3064945 RepID=UPI00273406E9|nr:hypothetical protein [Methylobacterium sp. NEAU 140]MDP4025675.1 hypothetical protein [Methylobacterium sp. NEAU 140]